MVSSMRQRDTVPVASAADDVVERDVAGQRGGRRGQGVLDHVATPRRQADLGDAPRRGEAEGGAQLAVEAGALGAHGAALAEGEHVGRGAGRHRRHPGIGRVEDGGAVGRQGGHQLALGLGDLVDRAERLGVHRGHAGHDPDGRTGHGAQGGDVAGSAGPHLDHRGLGAVVGADEREGHARARC